MRKWYVSRAAKTVNVGLKGGCGYMQTGKIKVRNTCAKSALGKWGDVDNGKGN